MHEMCTKFNITSYCIVDLKECETLRKFRIFDSHLQINNAPPRVFPHMCVQGSHMFVMFYAHALCGKWTIPVTHVHILR